MLSIDLAINHYEASTVVNQLCLMSMCGTARELLSGVAKSNRAMVVLL